MNIACHREIEKVIYAILTNGNTGDEEMANGDDALDALLAIAAGIAIGAGIIALLKMLSEQEKGKKGE